MKYLMLIMAVLCFASAVHAHGNQQLRGNGNSGNHRNGNSQAFNAGRQQGQADVLRQLQNGNNGYRSSRLGIGANYGNVNPFFGRPRFFIAF